MKYMAYLFDPPNSIRLIRGYSYRNSWGVILSYHDAYLCYTSCHEKSRFALGDLKHLLGKPDRYELYTSCYGYRSPSGSHHFEREFPSRSVYWKIDTQTYIRLHSDPTPLAQIVLCILPPLDLIDLLGE